MRIEHVSVTRLNSRTRSRERPFFQVVLDSKIEILAGNLRCMRIGTMMQSNDQLPRSISTLNDSIVVAAMGMHSS